mgnify:CR=1 FL=1|jgi:hypothetical protein
MKKFDLIIAFFTGCLFGLIIAFADYCRFFL